MTTLHVRLFGQLSLQQNEQPLVDLPAKALELLCYLLLHPARAHTREAVAEALWPGVAPASSQKYLRQTLWQLQAAWAKSANDQPEILLTDQSGWIRINPAASCWVDVTVFERACASCRDLPGQALSPPQAQALRAAVDLYQGDLLETWYQDWCLFERERLQLTYLAMLDKLMRYCEHQGSYPQGVEYGQRSQRYDPAREATSQQLMRLHYLAGDRTSALREYARCVKALAREFGVEPTAQTVALYEQIRADRLLGVVPARSAGEPSAPATPDAPGADLSQELAQLQASLAAFQQQMQQELAAIVRLLEIQQKTRQQTP